MILSYLIFIIYTYYCQRLCQWLGPFSGSDNGKTLPLILTMAQFISAATKGDYNWGGSDNRVADLTLSSFKVACAAPDIGLYLICIGV